MYKEAAEATKTTEEGQEEARTQEKEEETDQGGGCSTHKLSKERVTILALPRETLIRIASLVDVRHRWAMYCACKGIQGIQDLRESSQLYFLRIITRDFIPSNPSALVYHQPPIFNFH